MTIRRTYFDRVSFRADQAKRDPETGFIRINDASFTRSGVFRYLNDDGTERYEYRPPEEVFAREALDSMVKLPMFNDHPPVSVDSFNTSTYRPIGATGDTVKQRGDDVVGSLVLWDSSSIRDAEAGKTDLSMGYSTDVEEQAGVTPDGVAFTHIQRNIRYNHIAQVDHGRAGTARFRIDHGEHVGRVNQKRKDQRMEFEELLDMFAEMIEPHGLRIDHADGKKSVKVAGETFELNSKEDVNAAVKAFKAFATAKMKGGDAKAKKSDGSDDDARARLAVITAERDALRADNSRLRETASKTDSEEAKKAEAERFDAAVKERIAVLSVAKRFDLKADDLDKLSTFEVKREIVKADGHEIPADAEDAYVNAYFDIVSKRSDDGEDDIMTEHGRIDHDDDDDPNDDRTDRSERVDANAARLDMIDGLTERSKKYAAAGRDAKNRIRSGG